MFWLTPAIITTGRVFYEGQFFEPTLIRRIFSPFSRMKTRSLSRSAILPSKNFAYACHCNDDTPSAQPMYFIEGQDFDTTLIRRIFRPFMAIKTPGISHLAILFSKKRLTPATVTRRHDSAPSLICILFLSRTRTSDYRAYIKSVLL
jgi:hypothetical protein